MSTKDNKIITREDLEDCENSIRNGELCHKVCSNHIKNIDRCNAIWGLVDSGKIPHDYTILTENVFQCRICNNSKFKSVFITSSSRMYFYGKQNPDAFECTNCSIVFKDPIKFSKTRRK